MVIQRGGIDKFFVKNYSPIGADALRFIPMEQILLPWLPWLGTASLIMFVSALLFLPTLIGRLPKDVFIRRRTSRAGHPLLRILGLIIKNGAGLIFLFMGFVMLFVPGQGLLTMVAGLSLMNFPGKTALIHRLLAIKKLQKGLNALRRRMNREDFIFPS